MDNKMEEGLDSEGKAILDELEQAGHTIVGREPAKPPTEPEKPVEPAKVEPVKPADPAKPEPVKPAIEPGKPNDQKPNPDRKHEFVPLKKYRETEEQLKEANAKLEELTKSGAKPNAQQIDKAADAIKILVEQFNYDEDEAKKLADVIKAIVPGQTLTAEQQQALADVETTRKSLAEREEALKDEQDKILFNNDFADNVLKDFPHLANYKDQIKEMAYSETYSKTPLRAIALAFMDAEGISQKSADVITAERSGGGNAGGGNEINFDTITDEQFSKLTPEQQDKFFAHQEAKEKRARGSI